MKTIEEKRLDFINTQLQPYIDNPNLRCLPYEGWGMYYNPKTGNKCIIGKQILEDNYNKDIEGDAVASNKIFNLLPNHIQELGKEFLTIMQDFHDDTDYWSPELNELGKEKLRMIIKIYCAPILNEY